MARGWVSCLEFLKFWGFFKKEVSKVGKLGKVVWIGLDGYGELMFAKN